MIYDTDPHQPFLFSEPAFVPPAAGPRPRSRSLSTWRPLSRMGRHFVVDTNILLDDPSILNRAGSDHLCLPLDVLVELDRFKQQSGISGAHARSVHRILSDIFSRSEHPLGAVATRDGGSVQLVPYDPADARRVPVLRKLDRLLFQPSTADHRILACALLLRHHVEGPVVLVTRDLNLALKARVFAIETKPGLLRPNQDESGPPFPPVLDVSIYDLQRFASSGQLEVDPECCVRVALNEYLLLRGGEGQTIPARYHGKGLFRRLLAPSGLQTGLGAALKPLNFGQRCYVDSLLDPQIQLVTCHGSAGTGKTLLAIAAGLHLFLSGSYQGLIVSRPIVPAGDDLGYLPGTLEEKMHPWLQPIHDAFQHLVATANGKKACRRNPLHAEAAPAGSPLRQFVQAGVIEVQPLCYIRGRSIANRFFLLDEAQQLTPAEAKTAVTRMGAGAKLVLAGDPDQTDHPSLDSWSNGLSYTQRRLANLPFAAHIELRKSERSTLAEAAARLM